MTIEGHEHHHHHHGVSPDADRGRLATALALILGFMVAEVVAGVVSGSLALLSDAAHMLTDAASIALALVGRGWRPGRRARRSPSGSAGRRSSRRRSTARRSSCWRA